MDGLQVVVEQEEILDIQVHQEHQQVVLVVEGLEVLLLGELVEHIPLVVVEVVEHIQVIMVLAAVLVS